ncbi:MAG: DUF4834 family protein [Prevotella sp.]|nr:DUF4834 family protein [Prevotella sp.]
MFLLKFVLFIFIVGFFAVLITAWSFYNKVRDVSNRFRQQHTRQQTSRHTTVDGNVIIDQRSPDKANKKIIEDNEGEYVEYEESKVES